MKIFFFVFLNFQLELIRQCDCHSFRIIGGANATITNFPYQAQLVHETFSATPGLVKFELFCGGSIILPNFVLTAGHCLALSSRKDSSMRVLVGSDQAELGEKYLIKQVIHHPKLSMSTGAFDIGLVQLKTNLVYNNKIKPIKLPLQNSFVEKDQAATVTGFGTIKRDSNRPSTVLKMLNLDILSRNICNQKVEFFMKRLLDETQFCGLYLGADNQSTCNGDSGGPLVVNGVQMGIVSGSYECGKSQNPIIFTKISVLRNWIDEKTASLSKT